MATVTTLTRTTFEAGAWFCHKSRSESDAIFHFYRRCIEGDGFPHVEVHTYYGGEKKFALFTTLFIVEYDDEYAEESVRFERVCGDITLEGDMNFRDFVLLDNETIERFQLNLIS